VSESKKNLDPSDPAYYAPPRSRDRNAFSEKIGRRCRYRAVGRAAGQFTDRQEQHQSAKHAIGCLRDAVARMLREHGTGLVKHRPF